jgi:AcrR family transcriptional regulator
VEDLRDDLNSRLSVDERVTRPKHRRNARGQGSRLTEEIVSGALALIEREGTDEAVTLRAVAREIGIAAPSIYAHFADRDGIMMAVVARVFDELTEAISAALVVAGEDLVERLVAGCEAYVSFGLTHKARYKVLFAEQRPGAKQYCRPVAFGPSGRPLLEFGAESFALLVDGLEACIAGGCSASTDALADSTAIWVAMHGTVSLKTALPGFPWPEPADFVRRFVLHLARIVA